jgi:predicted amidohydrolase YtcJ
MSAAPPRLFVADRVITLDGADADALLVRDGRVLEAGNAGVLQGRYPEAAVERHQGTIVPGFNDAHQHLSAVAEGIESVDLSAPESASRRDVVGLIAARARETPPGGWVRASRYDHVKVDGGTTLTRADLDAISTDHPIMVMQVAGHWAIVNSRALEAAGLDDDSTPPPGGELGRDEHGHLDGVLYEEALFEFSFGDRRVVPRPPLETRLAGLRELTRRYHAAGITSIGDALVVPAAIDLYEEARRRGSLGLRVNMLLSHEHLDTWTALGLRTGFGDEWLRIVGIKAFVDGAIAGRTCLVHEPFEGTEDHGLQVTPTDELQARVRAIVRTGNRVAFHANGDHAIELLLDALESTSGDAPGGAAPAPRIEHCTMISPEILRRMRALRAIAVPFGSYIAFHGEKLLDWYGEQRLERMFAHRSLLDAGIVVAGSSDYPCGPFEPLLALQSCVTRQGPDGTVLGGTQRISVREALELYTVGSARAADEAHFKGRLAPGHLADFIVLDRDPEAVDPTELSTLGVVATYVGGERVWPE